MDNLGNFLSRILSKSDDRLLPNITDLIYAEFERAPDTTSSASDSTHFGLGFIKLEVSGQPVYGHSGGFTGHRTSCFYNPLNQVSVAVASNAKDTPVDEIVLSIHEAFLVYEHYLNQPVGKAGGAEKCPNMTFVNNSFAQYFAELSGNYLILDVDSWWPFSDYEIMTPTVRHKFKISKAADLASPYEEIEFIYDQANRLKKVIYGGSTLLPTADFYEKLKGAQHIG